LGRPITCASCDAALFSDFLPPSRRLFHGELDVTHLSELIRSVAETIKAGVDIAVDSKVAPLAAAPPAIVTGTSLFGVSWQNWMYISAFVYSALLIVGWVWNAVRKLRK
jgi:hypothetical protein